MAAYTYGVAPSPPDPHDYLRYTGPVALPATGSLAVNGWLPPVRNQQQDSDCVAAAMAYGRSAMRYRHLGEYVEYSFPWFWYQLREREGTLGQNAGTYPRDAMKVARKLGFCPESLMPQNASDVTDVPSAAANAAAFPYRITRYVRCPDLAALKTEITLGNQVLLAVLVNQYFEQAGSQGVISWNGDTNWLGGHAIWPYAYTDDGRFPGGGYVTFRNQWSDQWGIGGDAHLTYDVFSSPMFMECWGYE